MPHELPEPKVTAVSEEQREAFKRSDLAEEDSSVEDPLRGTLTFDANSENLDMLENMIKATTGVSDDEVSTPYPKFNEPYVTRNSVATQQDIYVPIGTDSEEDFNQDDYAAYAPGIFEDF